ncbi:hypothetical protein EBZ39_16085, partial [bacterium]|nr:hypothetical protein [bacterium]
MLTNYINVVDTAAMLSTYLKKADTTSLSNRINLKLNISDTTAMLSPYLKKADTTSLSNRINTKLNISDTTAMLSTYLKKADTASLSNRINLKLNIADTTAMLSTYLKKADTLSLSNRINTKLNISDTTAMLSTYLKKADTASLSNRINLKLNIADTSAMLSTYLKKADTLSLSNRINLKLNASDTTKYVKYADTSTTIATKANVALKLNISDTSVFARDWQIAGTANYLPRFTGSGGSIGNSNSYQTGDTLLTLMSPFYGLRLNSNTTPNSFTGWMPYSKMVLNVNSTTFAGIAMGDPANSPVSNQVAIQMTSWTGGGSNFYSTRLTNDNAGNFRIATSPVTSDANGTMTTRFSIMNDGKVGIGTTSPARSLHISATDAVRIPAGTNAQQTGGDAGDLRLNTDDSNLRFYDNTGWRAVMQSSNTVGRGTAGRVFYADADGRVAGNEPLYWDATNDRLGVNQATPIAPLDVNGGARITTVLEVPNIRNGTTANNVLTLAGNAAASGNTATSENIVFNVGNNGATRAMTMFNNGQVAI